MSNLYLVKTDEKSGLSLKSVDKFAALRIIAQIKISSYFVLKNVSCVHNDLVKRGDKRQTACKPGSVSAVRRRMAIHLGRSLPNASRDRPG